MSIAQLLAHSFNVTWTFVVPPENVRRVVITQRQDGPFRGNRVSGPGHYYVSAQHLVAGEWKHIEGSSEGAFCDFQLATATAAVRWGQLKAQTSAR